MHICEFGPAGDISGQDIKSDQVGVIRNTEIDGMLFQEFFQFGKRVLEINEDDDIAGSVHAPEETVFAIEDAVSRAGGIVEVVIPEVLADGRAFKYGSPCVSCKNQGRGSLLKAIALAGTVEHVLIVVDGNDR